MTVAGVSAEDAGPGVPSRWVILPCPGDNVWPKSAVAGTPATSTVATYGAAAPPGRNCVGTVSWNGASVQIARAFAVSGSASTTVPIVRTTNARSPSRRNSFNAPSKRCEFATAGDCVGICRVDSRTTKNCGTATSVVSVRSTVPWASWSSTVTCVTPGDPASTRVSGAMRARMSSASARGPRGVNVRASTVLFVRVTHGSAAGNRWSNVAPGCCAVVSMDSPLGRWTFTSVPLADASCSICPMSAGFNGSGERLPPAIVERSASDEPRLPSPPSVARLRLRTSQRSRILANGSPSVLR